MKLSENTKMGEEWKDWFQSHSVVWSEVHPHDVLTYLRQARRLSEGTQQEIVCLTNNKGQKSGANLMASEVQRLGNKAIVTFMVALRKAGGYDEQLKEVCAVMPRDLREAIEKELRPSEKLGNILESGRLGDIPAPAVSTTNITCNIANIQGGNHNAIRFRRDPENTGEDLDDADNYGNHGDGMNDLNDDDDDISGNDISGNDDGDETQSNTDNNKNEEVARNIAPDIVAEKNEVTSNIAPVIVAPNVAIRNNVEISGNDFSSSAQNNLDRTSLFGATGGASEHDEQGERDNETAIKEITETTEAISMSRRKEIAPSYQSSRPSEFSGVERDTSLRSQVSQSNRPRHTRDGQPDLFESSLGNREQSSGGSGGRDRFPTGDRDERSSDVDQRDGENNPSIQSVRSRNSLSSNNTNDGRPIFLSNLSDWEMQNIPATVPANLSLTSSLGAGGRNAEALNPRDFFVGTGSQQNLEGDITSLETDGGNTASAATSGLDRMDSFNVHYSGESEGLDNLAVAGQPVDSSESNSESSSAIITSSFVVGAVALCGYMIYKQL